MALKAALFGFSGIIIDDEAIRQTLSEQVLLDENLRPNPDDYRDVCLGRSDRACLKALLTQRGRNVTDETLDKLLAKESATYQNWLDQQETLPLYPGLEDLIFSLPISSTKNGDCNRSRAIAGHQCVTTSRVKRTLSHRDYRQ